MQRFAVFVALLTLALPTFAQTQQQPYGERVDVNVVLLDAIVTDERGNQILGLDKNDFVVRENGVEKPVESIDYFTNRTLLDSRESNAPFKVEQVREERYFIFFIDRPVSPAGLFDRLVLARDSIRDFIRNDMKEGDKVAIAGHDVRLKIYSDFTSDKKQLERSLDQIVKLGKGLTKASEGPAEGASILRNINTRDMINDTGTVYESLELLAESTRSIRARKNLVLFSPGIIEPGDTPIGGILSGRSQHLDPALRALNASNVTVYAANLQAAPALDPLFHQRLEEITEQTGGDYSRFNTTYGGFVDRVEDTNAGYYLITYKAEKRAGTTGFQKVQVSVRNQPQLKVTARPGYGYGS
ncbi:MAG TPA: VWA domain-containing protein [Thermoanaerobaculia bacterium]|jgi:VWFA-related protein